MSSGGNTRWCYHCCRRIQLPPCCFLCPCCCQGSIQPLPGISNMIGWPGMQSGGSSSPWPCGHSNGAPVVSNMQGTWCRATRFVTDYGSLEMFEQLSISSNERPGHHPRSANSNHRARSSSGSRSLMDPSSCPDCSPELISQGSGSSRGTSSHRARSSSGSSSLINRISYPDRLQLPWHSSGNAHANSNHGARSSSGSSSLVDRISYPDRLQLPWHSSGNAHANSNHGARSSGGSSSLVDRISYPDRLMLPWHGSGNALGNSNCRATRSSGSSTSEDSD